VIEVFANTDDNQENLFNKQDDIVTKSKSAYCVTIDISGKPVTFAVDTGCSVTLIDKTIYKTRFADTDLSPCTTKLRAYSGHSVETLGEFTADVKYENQTHAKLRVIVVKGNRPALLGREWLSVIKLNWPQIVCNVSTSTKSRLDEILAKHSSVFDGSYGKIRGYTASVTLKPDAERKHHKARTIPYSLHEVVAAEIKRQVASGILKPVEHSEWASPIVVFLRRQVRSESVLITKCH
jgi:hypothetical protein